jgi:hypothetical protein
VKNMQRNGPDTIAIEETPWQHTELDDVFVPSVRVQLGWKDVMAAVERGAVVPQRAHELWAGWASPLSGLRVGAHVSGPDVVPTKTALPDEPMPAIQDPGAVQRSGLWLVVGVLLGAGGAWLLLGG